MGVQPTVPADWQWISPELCGLVHDKTTDFDMQWTPAMTYPDAIFSISVRGTIEELNKGGFAGVLPWDDGSHALTGVELSQLKSEPVGFSALSYIEGPLFGFPESIYQENQSDSVISLSTQFRTGVIMIALMIMSIFGCSSDQEIKALRWDDVALVSGDFDHMGASLVRMGIDYTEFEGFISQAVYNPEISPDSFQLTVEYLLEGETESGGLGDE